MRKSDNTDICKSIESDYLTRIEAAKYLKIGLSSLDTLINKKNFHGKIKIGRRVLISKEKLNEYLKNNM